MATPPVTRNIALTPQLDRFVRAKVESGRYQSASEVVRESLRLMEQRDRNIDREARSIADEIEVGWRQFERGETIDGPSVFAEIRQLSKSRQSAAVKKKRRASGSRARGSARA